jgi:hypothetical protein
MKKLAAIALLTVSGIVMASAQGTVNFRNLTGAPNPANQVTYNGAGVDSAFTAELQWDNNGTWTSVATTPFRDGTLAGYFLGGSQTVAGAAGGTTVDARLLAYNGDMSITGMSDGFTITLGGAGSPPSLPADFTGFSGFAVTAIAVPEPTTLALLAMGAGCLFFRRRKN